MPSITIDLDHKALEELDRHAKHWARSTKDQARVFLLQILGLWHDKDAVKPAAKPPKPVVTATRLPEASDSAGVG